MVKSPVCRVQYVDRNDAPSGPNSNTRRILVKKPEGLKYKAVLSIDGGGVRGVIPAIVLDRLEDKIKEYIFENKKTVLPKEVQKEIHSLNDFDVDMTDYFEVVAGTSIGSILATYIANRGKGSEGLLTDPRVVKICRDQGKEARMGSMAPLRAVFECFGSYIFPKKGWFSRTIMPFFRASYSNKGLKTVLEKCFADCKTSDLETGHLVTTYDMMNDAGTSFAVSSRKERTNYTVSVATRTRPRGDEALSGPGQSSGAGQVDPVKAAAGEFFGDLDVITGTLYYLKDITLASSSFPVALPPVKINRLDDTNAQSYTLIDGGVIACNPTLQALMFAVADMGVRFKDVAVMSLGCGSSKAKREHNKNPGSLWWLIGDGNLMSVLQNGTSEYIQAVVDFWLDRELQFEPFQYTRIQKFVKEDEPSLPRLNEPEKMDMLIKMGKELADDNEIYLKEFVKRYFF